MKYSEMMKLTKDELDIEITNLLSLEFVEPFSSEIDSSLRLINQMADSGDLFIESWSDGEWFIANHPIGYSCARGLARDDGKKKGGEKDFPLAIARAWLMWYYGRNRYDMQDATQEEEV